jgi:hypothetical protein
MRISGQDRKESDYMQQIWHSNIQNSSGSYINHKIGFRQIRLRFLLLLHLSHIFIAILTSIIRRLPPLPFLPSYIRGHDHPLSYSHIQTEIPWASWDMGLHQITTTIHNPTLLLLLGFVLYGFKISGLKHAHQKWIRVEFFVQNNTKISL